MKKTLLITLGIIILLIVSGIWLYLMMFGTPTSTNEVFSDFGFEIEPQTITPIASAPISEDSRPSEVTEIAGPLKQLTTRPVAGYVILENESDTYARYVEIGTGHIFDLNLKTRAEERISGTTIPQVREAIFSADGIRVALTQISGPERNTFIGRINLEDKLTEGSYLPPDSDNLYLDENVWYTLSTLTETRGYTFTEDISEQRLVFSAPFKDIEVLWNETPILFYNRPAASLEGALFSVSANTIRPISETAFGYASIITTKHIISTKAVGGNLQAEAVEKISDRAKQLAITPFPEKCTLDTIDPDVLWCAAPLEATKNTDLEAWYRGEITSQDLIWEINLVNGEAVLITDPEVDTGRNLDVIQMKSDSATNRLLFINKSDNSLWMYDFLAI